MADDPIVFDAASPRFQLPYLYAGQAQKETFVNEAHARVDAMLHCTILAERTSPPVDPDDGQCWLVADDASDGWEGHEGTLACWLDGGWTFFPAREGMRVLDQSTMQERAFLEGGWKKALLPPEPIGGSTVDTEARASIGALIEALRTLGFFPSS